jgi:hypothetical protein
LEESKDKGDHSPAMCLLLIVIANSSLDADFQQYQRAIRYYADRLDEVWEQPLQCTC